MAGHLPFLTRPEIVPGHVERRSDEQQAAIARQTNTRALCRRRSAPENEIERWPGTSRPGLDGSPRHEGR